MDVYGYNRKNRWHIMLIQPNSIIRFLDPHLCYCNPEATGGTLVKLWHRWVDGPHPTTGLDTAMFAIICCILGCWFQRIWIGIATIPIATTITNYNNNTNNNNTNNNNNKTIITILAIVGTIKTYQNYQIATFLPLVGLVLDNCAALTDAGLSALGEALPAGVDPLGIVSWKNPGKNEGLLCPSMPRVHDQEYTIIYIYWLCLYKYVKFERN